MYYSLNNQAPNVSFQEAVIKGIASDRGLYFPKEISPLPNAFIKNINNYSNTEIAYQAIKQFVDNTIPDEKLKEIITDTLSFNFPLIKLNDTISVLELFHGPTMAFKDVGARFMALCLGFFNQKKNTPKVTVLVATSGDTGGAVANGFFKVDGVNVVILYPKGKVSAIQKKQLTTMGHNISALEVEGTFDDCQDMVKTAFLDHELKTVNLTSANSINVARWLPQMFYYFFAYKQLQDKEHKIAVSVPSGNFGNICAGMVAKTLGLPIQYFIAATNVNDTIPKFLETGILTPKKSKQTISNAMDVGNPSNFIRIQKLTNNDLFKLKKQFTSFSFTDTETKKAIKTLYKQYNYIADPHGAVGYLGLETFLKENPDTHGIFLETAHPVKFLDIVEKTLNTTLEVPKQIQNILDKKEIYTNIESYTQLKEFLLST